MKRTDALLRILIAFLGVLGLVISLYLLREHYAITPGSFCNINAMFNCTTVNSSPYAELFGIPVALFGSLFYIIILGFAAAPSFKRSLKIDDELLSLSFLGWMILGVIFSLYLTSVEAFLLRVFCPLCLFSAFLVLFLFVVAIVQYRRSAKEY